MKEVKNNDTQVRQEYEPMKVEVLKVTTQGVLCASGGGREVNGGLQSYIKF